MKIKKSVFALILAVAIVASFAAGATAAGTTAPVTAILDYGATVELNGVPQNFLDANGDRIYLLNYNDSMYLPVRKTAELVGLDVDWDGATHTVKLGNNMKAVDLIDDIGAYYLQKVDNNAYAVQHKSSEEKKWTISGTEVTNYLDLYIHGSWAGQGTKVSASFNLGGKYESVTFKCYCPKDATLRVYAGGESLQKEINIRGGAVAQEVTVPLFGSNELTFEGEKTTKRDQNTNTDIFIFNATVQ